MDRSGQWEAQVVLDLGFPSHLVGVWGVQRASPAPSYSSGEGQCIPEQGLERVKYAGVQGSTPPGSVPCLSTPLHQVSRAPKHPMPLRDTTHCAPNATTTR